MSGGRFDYNQYRIEEITGQLEEYLTGDEDYDEIPRDILYDIKTLSIRLKEDFIRLHRLDWYLSGDDDEDSYRERLKEELEELK